MPQSTTAIARPSSSAHRIEIDAYIAATFARFERVLVVQLPRLVEPKVAELSRALRQVGHLVETLVGFAVGSAFGVVARAVRRYCSKEVRAALDEVLGTAKHGNQLRAVFDTRDATGFFARDKPLVDELGSQLQARLCYAAADARRQVHTIQQLIERVAPDQVAHFATAMAGLLDDDTAAVELGEQLGIGWTHLVSVVTRKPAPALGDSPRTRQLWRTWSTHVRGAPVLAELTHEQVVAAGFVMRIG